MKRVINILLSIHSNPFAVKVVVTVIVFAAVSCVVVMLQLRSHMIEVLGEELHQKAQAITSDAVSRTTNSILVGEVSSLSEIIDELKSDYEDIDYIIIFDERGQPIVHSFNNNITDDLLKPEGIINENYPDSNVIIRDVPFTEDKVGRIQISMSKASLDASIDFFSVQLVMITIILTIIGVFGALIVAHLVTKPIRDLSTASKKIREGDLSQRVIPWGEDELGRLGEAFNLMASGIEKYTVEREALVRELRHNEQIRLLLLKKVITAQEDERKRISRELHDETSQSLTSLIIGLKLLEDNEMDDKQGQTVTAMKNLAAATLKEVHRLAVELRPTVLDDMGLIPAIERFVNGYSDNYNIDVDFHVQKKVNERLPGEVETALYRIVQEALTNIAKQIGRAHV